MGRVVRGSSCLWGKLSVGRTVHGASCRGASFDGAGFDGASFDGVSGPVTPKGTISFSALWVVTSFLCISSEK